MLVVETVAKIRRAFFVHGKAIKEICREFRLSRKVVRKVIGSDETAFSYQRSVQPRPKLGPWIEELDRLLAANAARSSRERVTLTRVFEDLRGLGYEGGYDAVRRYAASWRRHHIAGLEALHRDPAGDDSPTIRAAIGHLEALHGILAGLPAHPEVTGRIRESDRTLVMCLDAAIHHAGARVEDHLRAMRHLLH